MVLEVLLDILEMLLEVLELVSTPLRSYSVETMSGSFLSKFCVENWGDYSLKSSRGPKTGHPFFSGNFKRLVLAPLESYRPQEKLVYTVFDVESEFRG